MIPMPSGWRASPVGCSRVKLLGEIVRWRGLFLTGGSDLWRSKIGFCPQSPRFEFMLLHGIASSLKVHSITVFYCRHSLGASSRMLIQTKLVQSSRIGTILLRWGINHFRFLCVLINLTTLDSFLATSSFFLRLLEKEFINLVQVLSIVRRFLGLRVKLSGTEFSWNSLNIGGSLSFGPWNRLIHWLFLCMEIFSLIIVGPISSFGVVWVFKFIFCSSWLINSLAGGGNSRFWRFHFV